MSLKCKWSLVCEGVALAWSLLADVSDAHVSAGQEMIDAVPKRVFFKYHHFLSEGLGFVALTPASRVKFGVWPF